LRVRAKVVISGEGQIEGEGEGSDQWARGKVFKLETLTVQFRVEN